LLLKFRLFKNLSNKYLKKINELTTERKELLTKIDDLHKEIAQKEATIALLQKSEYEYFGLLSLDIERVKTNWIGWPEGATLEEIDLILTNNSSDKLTDVVLDLYLEDEKNIVINMITIQLKQNYCQKNIYLERFIYLNI